MKIEIHGEVIVKIERIIELYNNYKESTQTISNALKVIGKSQIEIAGVLINNNPDRDKLFNYIKNFNQSEKDVVKAMFEFGKDFDNPARDDFQFYIENSHLREDHEIDDMIAKPLSKHLKQGLMKLDIIKRIN